MYFMLCLRMRRLGFRYSIHFQRMLVIPLDHAMNLFTVFQDQNHRGPILHLLNVIEVLGIRLVAWNRFSPDLPDCHLIFQF